MLGLNRACLGNHEFDFGQKILESQMNRLMASGCLLLNSNITGGLLGTKPHYIDELTMPTGLKAPNGSDTFRLGWFGTCTTDTEAMAGKEKMGTMVFTSHMEANTRMTNLLKQVIRSLYPDH
jgi:2',3'-cyclic-nucleotide 2'-phosphodiesterase (5'-nucleotidase family)